MFSTDQDLIEHGEEFIQHFGVKGMKWGVRKNESSSAKDRRLKNKEIVLQKTLKGGGEVIVTKTPPLKVLQKLGGVIPKLGQHLDDLANFSIRDKNGKPVGDASFYRVGDHLSLDWIGIGSKHRGQGYATAAFGAAVQYAKDNGIKRVTLEVPGASPDALHIYEKFGFKKTGQLTSNDVWGGLTSMELLIEDAVKHADRSLLDYILEALDQVTENEGLMQMNNTAELRHFGVKGMKWGVRRDRIRKGRAEREINAKIQRNDKWGKSKKATSNSYAERVVRDEIRSKTGAGRLSDAELSARLKRIKMEKEYEAILREDREKFRSTITPAIKVARDILANVATNVMTDIATEKVKGYDRQKYRYAPSTHSAYTVDTIRKALPGPRVPTRR